jgi:hypothetical protein
MKSSICCQYLEIYMFVFIVRWLRCFTWQQHPDIYRVCLFPRYDQSQLWIRKQNPRHRRLLRWPSRPRRWKHRCSRRRNVWQGAGYGHARKSVPARYRALRCAIAGRPRPESGQAILQRSRNVHQPTGPTSTL